MMENSDHYEAIRNLKGVGDYTATPFPPLHLMKKAVVDGNVFRFQSVFWHSPD